MQQRRKSDIENKFTLLKLFLTTAGGLSLSIQYILIGIQCTSMYNMLILPALLLCVIPLAVYLQRKNNSKFFFFNMLVIEFFCFILMCVWSNRYSTYYTNSQEFYCPTNSKSNSDYTFKFGYGSIYHAMLGMTFFHLLECFILVRKIYDLATSIKEE